VPPRVWSPLARLQQVGGLAWPLTTIIARGTSERREDRGMEIVPALTGFQ